METVSKHDTRFAHEIALAGSKSDAKEVHEIIASQLGDAAKPAREAVGEDLAASPMVEAMGGLRANQSLYVQDLGAGLTLVRRRVALEQRVALHHQGGRVRIVIL